MSQLCQIERWARTSLIQVDWGEMYKLSSFQGPSVMIDLILMTQYLSLSKHTQCGKSNMFEPRLPGVQAIVTTHSAEFVTLDVLGLSKISKKSPKAKHLPTCAQLQSTPMRLHIRVTVAAALLIVLLCAFLSMIVSCGASGCVWEKATDTRGLNRHRTSCHFYRKSSILASKKRLERAKDAARANLVPQLTVNTSVSGYTSISCRFN